MRSARRSPPASAAAGPGGAPASPQLVQLKVSARVLAMLGRSVRPVPAQRRPPAARLLRVQRRVLRNDCGQPIGVPQRQPEPYRAAEVHDVDGELTNAKLVEQLVDHPGKMIKRVVEARPVGYCAVPESRIVRRDDVILVRELREQVAELPRRRGEAMQQEQHRRIRGPRLAVANIDSFHDGVAVMHGHRPGLLVVASGASTLARSRPGDITRFRSSTVLGSGWRQWPSAPRAAGVAAS